MEAAQPLKLWELTDELEAIAAEVMEAEGELTPEMEERLEAIEGAWEEKVERVALKVRELEALAKAAKEEADRLGAIQKAYQRGADGLKSYLHVQLHKREVPKVETARARVRVQKNGRPSILWTRELDELPETFRKVEVKCDTQAAYREWKEGGELPEGFEVREGTHVRIQ